MSGWLDRGSYLESIHPQGSQEWLDVKAEYVTPTYAVDLMGLGFNTKEHALVRLSGIAPPSAYDNFTPEQRTIMQKGHICEAASKVWYAKRIKATITDVGFITPKLETDVKIGISLDGQIRQGNKPVRNLECKYTERISHELLEQDYIDAKHMFQMQMGMAVTGEQQCDYLVYIAPLKEYYITTIDFNKKYWIKQYAILKDIILTELSPLREWAKLYHRGLVSLEWPLVITTTVMGYRIARVLSIDSAARAVKPQTAEQWNDFFKAQSREQCVDILNDYFPDELTHDISKC